MQLFNLRKVEKNIQSHHSVILIHQWLASHLQSSFLLQQIRTNTHSQKICRVKGLGRLNPKWGVFIITLPFELRKLCEKGSGRSKARKWRTSRSQGLLHTIGLKVNWIVVFVKCQFCAFLGIVENHTFSFCSPSALSWLWALCSELTPSSQGLWLYS